MKKGNVNAALKIVTNNMNNGILPLTEERLNSLKIKHPEKNEANEQVLLPDIPPLTHPIRFEEIDEERVRRAAMRTRGGSGPSGMDADG